MEDENIIISLENCSRVFGKMTALYHFDLNVKKGEFVTLLGPSGCGKTTTLRLIAGFDKPTEGRILLNGQDITDVPPYKRPINTVFQRYALFPHLNVFDNVAFGLKLQKVPVTVKKKNGKDKTKMKHLPAAVIYKRVMHALKIVDLEELENRDISTLSGGQQQRVAIARAIVNEPEILLLDEPLGALDLKLRKEMQLELKEMHKRLGITFIYVTHDQEEALTMSDTIVVMKAGEIQQVGTPTEVYNEPANAYVANFVGESNIYNATYVSKNKVRFLGHFFEVNKEGEKNDKVDVTFRPEDVMTRKVSEDYDGDKLLGKIQSKVFKGTHFEYVALVGKSEVVFQTNKQYEVDDYVTIEVDPEDLWVMKKDVTSNIFPEAWINKSNEVVISDYEFECDITQLLEGSHVDEDDYLVGPDGKKYYLKDADVIAEIGLDDIDVVEDETDDMLKAFVASSTYIGDHYQILLRTLQDEDFIFNSPYLYTDNDCVGIVLKKENIKLTLKGDISKYEVEE